MPELIILAAVAVYGYVCEKRADLVQSQVLRLQACPG